MPIASPPAPAAPSPAAPRPVVRAAGRATLLTIAFVLLSRVLGVVRSMVISHVFGQNDSTDIYIRAFALPDMLQLMLAGGALSAVFIPVFTEYLQKGKEEDAWKTFGRIVTLVAISITGIIIVAEILAWPIGRLLAPKFSDEALAQMVPMTRILLPAQWFFFVGGLIIATLQSRDRWLIPGIAPLVYNAGIIVGAVFFGHKIGTVAMTWGALIGAFLGNFLLPLWDLQRSGVRWRLGFHRADFRPLPKRMDGEEDRAYRERISTNQTGVQKFLVLLLPAMLGLGLSQLGFLITGFFLNAKGELTALRNGYELTQAPIGIFAQASALVLFPTLSRLAAAGDKKGLRMELEAGLRRILFLTVPASLLMAVLAEPIITLLYAGIYFGANEVAHAALALRLYSLGTFAWSAQAVVGRGFFAMQDTRTPLRITRWMIVLFALLCFVSVQIFGQGFGALALCMSAVGTLNMLLLLFALRKELRGLDLPVIGLASLHILVVAGTGKRVGLGNWSTLPAAPARRDAAGPDEAGKGGCQRRCGKSP